MNAFKAASAIALVILHLVFMAACSGDPGIENRESFGQVPIDLEWNNHALTDPGEVDGRHPAGLVLHDDGTINCEASNAATIFVNVYDQASGDLLMNNGDGWDCANHIGIIYGVPAGPDRKIVCYARDAAQNILFRGEQADVTVSAGADAQNRVQMEMNPFTTEPQGHGDGAMVHSNALEFGCTTVPGASAYQFQVAADFDFESILVDQSAEGNLFSSTIPSASGICFWRVRSIDPYGLAGAWSMPRTLNIALLSEATTGAATAITADTANLNGSVNPMGMAASCYFEYGTSTAYGFTTEQQDAGAGTQAVAVLLPVSGLASETIYHYRMVAENSAGATYGQDDVFTTADITSPSVTGVTPADGGINISESTAIMAVFTEPIDETTLTPVTFLANDGLTDIGGTITYDNSIATFIPSFPLSTDTRYTVTLTTGVSDLNGHSLSQDYVWSFTTRETIAPTVLEHSLFPQPDNWGVGVAVTIKATFSEAMDPTTINGQSVMVQEGGNLIDGTVTYDDATKTASFAPERKLPCDTVFNVTITTQARDMARNSMPMDKQWQFTTTSNCGAQVVTGGYHSLYRSSYGSLWAWGRGSSGELGDGDTSNSDRLSPVWVAGGDWADVAAGSRHTVAVKTDGSLWTWGDVKYGSGREWFYSPKRIGTENDWAIVGAGAGHNVALKTDGSLWTWGLNSWGQLGNGTDGDFTDTGTPARIGSDTWLSVAAGHVHTLAIKTDGSLWHWGQCDGNPVDGSFEVRNTPTLVVSGNDWSFVAADQSVSFALKSDGSLWGWGSDAYGRLGVGDGYGLIITTPVKIPGNYEWTLVDPGFNHTIGRQSDGSLWSWGSNRDGQLGDPAVADRRNTPGPVAGGDEWDLAAAGFYHSIGLKANGGLMGWGGNDDGQVGDGTQVTRVAPTPVDTSNF